MFGRRHWDPLSRRHQQLRSAAAVLSVPRLCRGVHRPAAAALRSGAGVGVGRHGYSPAAAVPGKLPRARGWGDASDFLARLRGQLGIQG